MHSILSDLKLVGRQLRTSPGFTATAVLMLALGIGATTAIFSIVDGVLLRPLPFPKPAGSSRSATRSAAPTGASRTRAPSPAPKWSSIRATLNPLKTSAAYGYTASGSPELASRPRSRRAHDALRLLRARCRAAHGPRLHRTGRSAEAAGRGAELRHMEEPLQRRPAHLGTKVLLDRKPYVIIGVMPRTSSFRLFPAVSIAASSGCL